MKKKRMVLLLFVVIFSVVCGSIVSNATKDTYTFDWLVENSNYIIIANNSRPIKKTENPKYTVLYSSPISEYHKKEGKYYLELDTSFSRTLVSEGVTIVSDKKHIKLDKYRLYILFLNEIEGQEGFYTITNGKTGIIELKPDRLKPYDSALKKDLSERFENSDAFLEWFNEHCEKDAKIKEQEQKEALKTEPHTAPETTSAPY